MLLKLVLLWGLWAAAVVAIDAALKCGTPGLLLAVAIGVASGALVVTGIGFIGHDVCHGSVVSRERMTRVVAFFSLTLALFLPYRLWIRWHNAFHHHYANTLRDSDRLLREEERAEGVVIWPLYRFANLFGLSLQYVGLRMWKIIYGRKTLADPKKREDVSSLILAATLYGALGIVLPDRVFVAGILVPLIVGAVTVSLYIQSNHFLRPQMEEVDEITGSMDVDVPRAVDFLHSNFSAHTAHHLFPTVASRHYPEIRRRIAAEFPVQYRSMPFWRALVWNLTRPKLVRQGRWLVDTRGRIRAELH